MAKKYFVIIAGSGETSRENLDALLDDHFFANGAGGVLLLPANHRLSTAQAWAAQLATQRNKEVVVVGAEGMSLAGIGKASLLVSDNPLEDSLKNTDGEETDCFILWDPEDRDSHEMLRLCGTYGLPAYNLCDGLSDIPFNGDISAVTEPLLVVEDAPKNSPEVVRELLKHIPVLTPSVIDDMRLQEAVETIIDVIVKRVIAQI